MVDLFAILPFLFCTDLIIGECSEPIGVFLNYGIVKRYLKNYHNFKTLIYICHHPLSLINYSFNHIIEPQEKPPISKFLVFIYKFKDNHHFHESYGGSISYDNRNNSYVKKQKIATCQYQFQCYRFTVLIIICFIKKLSKRRSITTPCGNCPFTENFLNTKLDRKA